MTEKAKMLNGELYDSSDKQLVDELIKAKKLCNQYNNLCIEDIEKGNEIIKKLFSKTGNEFMIMPNFYCDYGFNIHMHGLVIINCNCVILDTSPVNIGTGTFIATGVPCKVIRPITEKDKIAPEGFCFEHTDFVFVSMN